MNRHSSENHHVAKSSSNLDVKQFKALYLRPYLKSKHPSDSSTHLKLSYPVKSKSSDKSSEGNKPSARSKSFVRSRLESREHRAPRVLPRRKQNLNLELRQEALHEARTGRHNNAIALFDELVSREPLNASHYNNRGLVYFQMDKFDQAIADYNKAITLNPELDSAYNNRANYYACKGQLLSAILDYDVAININPDNVRAWINQGITFRELYMFERSIECFDTALNLGQIEGNIYAERGRTYHLWGDWNMAIADYNRAIALLPFSADDLTSSSARLRLQVELWIDDLLGPLNPESYEYDF
ncbi:MAG: tetratricopeptide repeat protein [Leptolyngbyaceae bacterium]|nr:tetratricopeptide repeat protein [Leptolyngbyaceae bacterium]